MSKIKLFTHTDLDGVGCAILAYLAFGRENVDVEYCDYKNINENVRDFYLNERDKSYDAVYITDISVNEEVAEEINLIATVDGRWKLIDHHATAEWLNKYGWCEVRVERAGIKSSGTSLFYMHLQHAGYYDAFIKYGIFHIADFVVCIRDYDTWRWKELGEVGLSYKKVNDLFHIYGKEKFIDWVIDQLSGNHLIGYEFPSFNDMDEALLEQKQKDIDIYIESKNKQLTHIVTDDFEYTFGIVFADRYISELGNRLSELHPELDYIAMIDISRGVVSYRTVRDDIDLGGEIAHSFGGGGHRKAAGSTFDASKIREVVLGEIFRKENKIL